MPQERSYFCMTANNCRNLSDRWEYDIGFAVLNKEHVNRRLSERRESDKFRRRLKDLLELHMEDSVLDKDLNSLSTQML